MTPQDSMLPRQGEQIDTRPMYVEEWLDSLPYVDFKKTSDLLNEATRATNEQDIKPATRMELVELYGRPYQYYIDSQIKAGAQQTLQSIKTAQQQVKILKKIAINLGLACKIAAEDELKRKTLWGQKKPPLLNYLLSLNFLSHALIFSFLEYAPTPKNVWREINFIYDFAESIKMENTSVALPESHSNHGSTSIAQAYKRIVMATLSDPHHLPYGAIWEIYEQLTNWSNLVEILPYTTQQDPACRFILKLDSDANPIPYVKFNTGRAGDTHRLVDASSLTSEVQRHMVMLEKGMKLDKSLVISPYFARMTLGHLLNVWGLPSKRGKPRKERDGTLQMACGLIPVYYFINNGKDFSPPVETQEDEVIDAGDRPGIQQNDIPAGEYQLEKWALMDQSAGGFAVIKNIRPTYNIRVGDLVTMNTRGAEQKWALGVIRWLMIREEQVYKIGVQLLGTSAKTAAIRARSGSAQDTRYQRALVIPGQDNKADTVITGKGFFMRDRELELMLDGHKYQTKTAKLMESTTGFEQFTLSTPVA